MSGRSFFKVFLSPHPSIIRNGSSDNQIFIHPDRGNFNDFGYITKVKIRITTLQRDLLLEGFFGNPNLSYSENGKYYLNNLTETQQYTYEEIIKSNKNNDNLIFFTMLKDLGNYRSLVESFGPEIATDICVALNDVTIEKQGKENKSLRALMINSDVFNKSFIRNTESFIAFKNAYSILQGLDKENSNIISNNISIDFKDDLPSINFNFLHESELPRRVSLIIGENGVGKSRILNRIISESIKGGGGIFTLSDDKIKERISINRILAFTPTNESRVSLPSDKSKRNRMWYKNFLMNRTSRRRVGDSTNDIIVTLIRTDEVILNKKRFDIFIETISKVHNFENIVLPLTNNNLKFVSLKDIGNFGEEASLSIFSSIKPLADPLRLIDGKAYELSSGEISFIRFCAQACTYIENGSLLLLDEPETHLHPNFISSFFSLLDYLLKKTHSIAIIATHSVYFVREVFKEQVTVIKRNDNQSIEYLKPRINTFGADIGTISYFVFGEDEPSQTLDEVKGNILNKYTSWEVVYNKFKDDLSINTLTSIRKEMTEGGDIDE